MIFSEKLKQNHISASNNRYMGFDWANIVCDILVVGQGGIGSMIMLPLSRIGHTITTFDADEFERHNFAGQLVLKQYDTLNKATSVAQMMHSGFGTENIIRPQNRNWDSYFDTIKPITISCVDSITTRKELFTSWVNSIINKDWDKEVPKMFIDVRMGALQGEIYCIYKASQFKEYEKSFFSEEEAYEVACNVKATTHCAMMLSSLAVGIMNNAISNKLAEFDIYDVPFHTAINFNEISVVKNNKFVNV